MFTMLGCILYYQIKTLNLVFNIRLECSQEKYWHWHCLTCNFVNINLYVKLYLSTSNHSHLQLLKL